MTEELILKAINMHKVSLKYHESRTNGNKVHAEAIISLSLTISILEEKLPS